MRIGKHDGMMLVLFLVLSVTGCGTETDMVNKAKDPNKAPEVGASLTSGPVLLNVAGAGHHIGDIVQIDTDVLTIIKGSVILFDWRKATGGPGGFGPAHMIGEVVGLPGDQLDMSTFLKFKGRDGKEKNAWFSTFEKRGAKNYDGNITLSVGGYLVETDSHIIIVDHESIGALVVERLGHDEDAEKEIKQRVY